MSRKFVVVHEAPADFDTATSLADRVLLETIDWLEEEHLATQREWIARLNDGRQLTWKSMRQLASDAGIRAHGRFDGQPALADAAAARRAILFLLAKLPDLEAIVLIRDQDDQPDRRKGLEQARAEDKSGRAIAIGLAVVERECWLLSGFEPRNEDETARLANERSRLGFDPRHRNHELTACKDDQAVHSPKRVLQALACGVRHRERQCWAEADLELLRQRGSQNGLAAYLTEVRDHLAPLIGHIAQS